MELETLKAQQADSFERKPVHSVLTVIYSSFIMRNALASLVNLLTLLIGIAIGITLAPRIERKAQAVEQTQANAQSTPVTGDSSLKPVSVEKIQPVMTAGSVGAYLLLAHHVQSDEIVVNGFDLLKLHDAELGLISRFVPANQVQQAVNGAKVEKIYQIATPESQPNTTPKK